MAICQKENGEYYAWGSNKKEILPIDLSIHKLDGKDNYNITKPFPCSNIPDDVVSVKMSLYNIIFLTGGGEVYKCGLEYINDKGKGVYSRIPKLIKDIPLIKKISCCDVNFSLLDYEGNIWTFGKYSYEDISELDVYKINDDIKLPYEPVMIKRNDIKNVIDISKGGYFTFLKTRNGDIFYFDYDSLWERDDKKIKCYNNLRKLNESPSIWKTNCGKSRQKSARK